MAAVNIKSNTQLYQVYSKAAINVLFGPKSNELKIVSSSHKLKH